MSSELEIKAAEAWRLVTRPRSIFDAITGQEPMLVGVALDYVQEVTGDRDDAVTALLWASSNSLEEEIPENLVNLRDDAIGLLSDLRGEYFAHAESAAATISFRAQDTAHAILSGPSLYDCDKVRP